MIRISHQRAKCIGCNYCIEVAPNSWYMDESDGKARLKESVEKKGIFVARFTDDEYEANVEAQNICPVHIIKVEKY